MKIIDLLNKLVNGEEVPKNIKIDGINYIFDEWENFYYRDNESREDLLVLGKDYSTLDFLTWNVELIEEDTIEIDSIEKLNDTCYDDYLIAREKEFYHNLTRTRLNEVIQAVKQLNKEIKELKEKTND